MLRCMRTTIRLDEHLLAQAKRYAAASAKKRFDGLRLRNPLA